MIGAADVKGSSAAATHDFEKCPCDVAKQKKLQSLNFDQVFISKL